MLGQERNRTDGSTFVMLEQDRMVPRRQELHKRHNWLANSRCTLLETGTCDGKLMMLKGSCKEKQDMSGWSGQSK